jgi:vancomycin permeability regulator SanA
MKTLKYIFLTALSVALVAATAIVTDGLTDNVQKADVMVILGNKIELDGTPSKRLQSRLDKGIELYTNGYANTIIVSGGIGWEGFDEAKVMKEYLVANGIASESIVIDSKGIDSYNTAQNTKAFLAEHNLSSVLIVTNYFHISRTRLALKKFGVETIYSAHAHYFELRDLFSIPREVVGYLYYLVRKY